MQSEQMDGEVELHIFFHLSMLKTELIDPECDSGTRVVFPGPGRDFQICRDRACHVTRDAAFCKLHSKISGSDLRSLKSRDPNRSKRDMYI